MALLDAITPASTRTAAYTNIQNEMYFHLMSEVSVFNAVARYSESQNKAIPLSAIAFFKHGYRGNYSPGVQGEIERMVTSPIINGSMTFKSPNGAVQPLMVNLRQDRQIYGIGVDLPQVTKSGNTAFGLYKAAADTKVRAADYEMASGNIAPGTPKSEFDKHTLLGSFKIDKDISRIISAGNQLQSQPGNGGIFDSPVALAAAQYQIAYSTITNPMADAYERYGANLFDIFDEWDKAIGATIHSTFVQVANVGTVGGRDLSQAKNAGVRPTVVAKGGDNKDSFKKLTAAAGKSNHHKDIIIGQDAYEDVKEFIDSETQLFDKVRYGREMAERERVNEMYNVDSTLQYDILTYKGIKIFVLPNTDTAAVNKRQIAVNRFNLGLNFLVNEDGNLLRGGTVFNNTVQESLTHQVADHHLETSYIVRATQNTGSVITIGA